MTRYGAARAAIAMTAALGVVLVAMAVLDAAWLGFAAIALLFAALVARGVTVLGARGFLVFAGGMLALIGAAYAVARLT